MKSNLTMLDGVTEEILRLNNQRWVKGANKIGCIHRLIVRDFMVSENEVWLVSLICAIVSVPNSVLMRGIEEGIRHGQNTDG